MANERRYLSRRLPLMTTTLWDYPSQNYPGPKQGDPDYVGATPSYVIWNLLQRYTKPKELVVDPMAGSGTTLDVARELDRRALGYDVAPPRDDVFRADARHLPLEAEKADFVFVDPPYSTHVRYSGRPDCIGELDAREGKYFPAMAKVIGEIHRILRPDRYMALYVSDSYQKGKPFVPIGFELFAMLVQLFEPVDVIAVARHNRNLKRRQWHLAAEEGNYFLRGFNYLFVMYKPKRRTAKRVAKDANARSQASRPPSRSRPSRPKKSR